MSTDTRQNRKKYARAKRRAKVVRRLTMDDCEKKTGHAQLPGERFCLCTGVMYGADDSQKEGCNETRLGGGRTCFQPLGHIGPHAYECGSGR